MYTLRLSSPLNWVYFLSYADIPEPLPFSRRLIYKHIPSIGTDSSLLELTKACDPADESSGRECLYSFYIPDMNCLRVMKVFYAMAKDQLKI